MTWRLFPPPAPGRRPASSSSWTHTNRNVRSIPDSQFTGYLPRKISSNGIVTERQITSADNSIVGVDRTAQTFDLSGNVGGGFGASGAGDWGAYGGNNYVLGTVLGTTDTNAVASYITPSEFYSVFALQGTPSTSTHNLIIGSSSGHEDIRGSFQTTDIIGAGDRNLILAAGNGDTINPGPGENNILFPSKALATPS